VGTATAFGTQAAGLLGQKGCKTQLLSFVALDVAERVDVLAPIKHIQVRCGPEGAADLWDADGRELWLDIMAGVGLPRRPEEVAIEVFSQAPHDYDMLRNARVSPMASVYVLISLCHGYHISYQMLHSISLIFFYHILQYHWHNTNKLVPTITTT
jgi:hypothetical protein